MLRNLKKVLSNYPDDEDDDDDAADVAEFVDVAEK
jgi:hypothetical protein